MSRYIHERSNRRILADCIAEQLGTALLDDYKLEPYIPDIDDKKYWIDLLSNAPLETRRYVLGVGFGNEEIKKLTPRIIDFIAGNPEILKELLELPENRVPIHWYLNIAESRRVYEDGVARKIAQLEEKKLDALLEYLRTMPLTQDIPTRVDVGKCLIPMQTSTRRTRAITKRLPENIRKVVSSYQ